MSTTMEMAGLAGLGAPLLLTPQPSGLEGLDLLDDCDCGFDFDFDLVDACLSGVEAGDAQEPHVPLGQMGEALLHAAAAPQPAHDPELRVEAMEVVGEEVGGAREALAVPARARAAGAGEQSARLLAGMCESFSRVGCLPDGSLECRVGCKRKMVDAVDEAVGSTYAPKKSKKAGGKEPNHPGFRSWSVRKYFLGDKEGYLEAEWGPKPDKNGWAYQKAVTAGLDRAGFEPQRGGGAGGKEDWARLKKRSDEWTLILRRNALNAPDFDCLRARWTALPAFEAGGAALQRLAPVEEDELPAEGLGGWCHAEPDAAEDWQDWQGCLV